MTDIKLAIICSAIVAMTLIGSVGYFRSQETALMSRNIESAIVKGIDPVAVRCAYTDRSSDTICIAYAASKPSK